MSEPSRWTAEIEVYGKRFGVVYDYTPGRPAVFYLRNGDPGYPAEGLEVDVVCVTLLRNGSWQGERDVNLDRLPSAFMDALVDAVCDYEEEYL